jgi:hypothetical protein
MPQRRNAQGGDGDEVSARTWPRTESLTDHLLRQALSLRLSEWTALCCAS